jgi:hypothetical protein
MKHVGFGDMTSHAEFLSVLVAAKHRKPCEVLQMQTLTDEAIMRTQGPVVWVLASNNLNLSADAEGQITRWELSPFQKGSAAINAACRHVAATLGMEEVARDIVDYATSSALDELDSEAPPQAFLWELNWILSDPEIQKRIQKRERWHPWEKPWKWMEAPPERRLHVLYRDLVGWVLAQENAFDQAKKFGISPKRFQWLKQQKLRPEQVDAALVVLSPWRSWQTDPYIAALQVGCVFDSRQIRR